MTEIDGKVGAKNIVENIFHVYAREKRDEGRMNSRNFNLDLPTRLKIIFATCWVALAKDCHHVALFPKSSLPLWLICRLFFMINLCVRILIIFIISSGPSPLSLDGNSLSLISSFIIIHEYKYENLEMLWKVYNLNILDIQHFLLLAPALRKQFGEDLFHFFEEIFWDFESFTYKKVEKLINLEFNNMKSNSKTFKTDYTHILTLASRRRWSHEMGHL